jgi:hypothetical protein
MQQKIHFPAALPRAHPLKRLRATAGNEGGIYAKSIHHSGNIDPRSHENVLVGNPVDIRNLF